LAAFSENTHNILPKHIKAAIEDSEFVVPPGRLPLKQIGFAAALLVLGIALGAGWQHLASLPLKVGAAAPAVQTAAAPAAQAPIQEKPAQSAPSWLQQRLDASQTWLAGEEGSRFTLQLALTDSDDATRLKQILDKIDREIGLQQVYVYPTRITAQRQFGITFGDFASREHALASIDNLPPGYKKANYPKLRTVKGIRDEMAKQQQRQPYPIFGFKNAN